MITDEIVEFIEEEIAVYRNRATYTSGVEQEQATAIANAIEALLEKLCNEAFSY